MHAYGRHYINACLIYLISCASYNHLFNAVRRVFQPNNSHFFILSSITLIYFIIILILKIILIIIIIIISTISMGHFVPQEEDALFISKVSHIRQIITRLITGKFRMYMLE